MRFANIWAPFLFLTILITGCCVNNNIHPSAPQIAKMANNDTVALISELDDEPFCTGVWVSESVILTANHCVEGYAQMLYYTALSDALKKDGCPEEMLPLLMQIDPAILAALAEEDPAIQHVLQVIMSVPRVNPQNLTIPYTVQNKTTDDGVKPLKTYHGKAYLLSHNQDLALIRVDQTEELGKHGIVVLADKTPEVGERVYSTGQAMGGYWNFRDGVVSAYKEDLKHAGVKKDGPFMQITILLAPGDSGSGVYNSDGQLVGIGSFIKPKANLSFCVHLETIRGFLQGQKLAPVRLDLTAPDPKLN